jgi:hypothetical protein
MSLRAEVRRQTTRLVDVGPGGEDREVAALCDLWTPILHNGHYRRWLDQPGAAVEHSSQDNLRHSARSRRLSDGSQRHRDVGTRRDTHQLLVCPRGPDRRPRERPSVDRACLAATATGRSRSASHRLQGCPPPVADAARRPADDTLCGSTPVVVLFRVRVPFRARTSGTTESRLISSLDVIVGASEVIQHGTGGSPLCRC